MGSLETARPTPGTAGCRIPDDLVAPSRQHYLLARSDPRGCSDGLKIKCESGQSVTTTFAKDCCKRDDVARMALCDAATVLAQLPAAFEHFNEAHPHSSSNMRSPREFWWHQAAQARPSPVVGAALRCDWSGCGGSGASIT
ncbi:hypothetical protein Tther_00072 [Tepidimonas thermarum]|uniref:Integrase core domain protein n=1 Tax=Tepidimonas thermarum TaxID=335431 RepID=A0A554X8X5_9BURK|nr:hypothetical protein Tther_00072 [Tepidimonas thermarum]